jgi:hypothetical protein
MNKNIANKTTAPKLTLTADEKTLAELHKAVKTPTPTAEEKAKAHHNTNGKAVEIKKGSELDTVLNGVTKNPGLSAVELKKKIRFAYPPMRALKKLLKMGLVVKDRKEKTYTAT